MSSHSEIRVLEIREEVQPRPYSSMSVLAARPRISLKQVEAAVCARLGPARVPGNAQPAVLYRQIAMYLAKHVGGWSLSQIGRFYNGRDHSTVHHAIRKIERLRPHDTELDEVVTSLATTIKENSNSRGPCRDQNIPQSVSALHQLQGSEQLLDALADRIAQRLKRDSQNG